jgi:hypothetical protein
MLTLLPHIETSEGLHRLLALQFYCRILFAIRLLPLLHAANGLSRVVSISSGGYEGAVDTTDIPALKLPLYKIRGHASSITTLAFRQLASENPDVSFVTDHPGTVVTPGIYPKGVLGYVPWTIITLFGRWITVPLKESAERHLFLATSGALPPKSGKLKGLPLVQGLDPLVGIDGRAASGLYSVQWNIENPEEKTVALLDNYKEDGTQQKVWDHVMEELQRIERAC